MRARWIPWNCPVRPVWFCRTAVPACCTHSRSMVRPSLFRSTFPLAMVDWSAIVEAASGPGTSRTAWTSVRWRYRWLAGSPEWWVHWGAVRSCTCTFPSWCVPLTQSSCCTGEACRLHWAHNDWTSHARETVISHLDIGRGVQLHALQCNQVLRYTELNSNCWIMHLAGSGNAMEQAQTGSGQLKMVDI